MILIFTLLLLILANSNGENCNPRYIRLFYNPAPAPELKVDMILMFNTNDDCQDSYVKVSYANSQTQYTCTRALISIDGPIVPYLQEYVHNCQLQIDSASQIYQFNYTVIGSLTDTSQQSPYYFVQLAQRSLPLMLIVTANMNMLDDNLYKNFATAFQELLQHRDAQLNAKKSENNFRISGVIINGGFANNFTQNKGLNYNKIMTLISQYSSRWPLMVNIGPSEIQNKTDLALIQQCFILGGLQSGKQRIGMQGYRFPGKVNIALVQTSSQYFHKNDNASKSFTRTVNALQNFFVSNKQNGTQFSIVLNHYPIFCSNDSQKVDQNNYTCIQGEKKLQPLKDLIVNSKADLYIGAYKSFYERTFAFNNGQFQTLQSSRFSRGSLISLNQGTGGQNLNQTVSLHKPDYIAQKYIGRPGFGIISIKGNAQMKDMNKIQLVKTQTQIIQKLNHKQSPTLQSNNLLDPNYIEASLITQNSLFLLNYKHITIIAQNDLLVEDNFWIVDQATSSKQDVQRHNLRIEG